jgi:PRTRC genetic system protein E
MSKPALFTSLLPLLKEGRIYHISASIEGKPEDELLRVNIFPQQMTPDEKGGQLRPLSLTAKAEELDEKIGDYLTDKYIPLYRDAMTSFEELKAEIKADEVAAKVEAERNKKAGKAAKKNTAVTTATAAKPDVKTEDQPSMFGESTDASSETKAILNKDK